MIEFSPELQVGPGVRLRFYAPADAESLAGVIDANRAHLRQWMPWVDSGVTPRDLMDFIERSATRAVEGTAAQYMIERDGRIAGTIGFNNVSEANRSAMIGYWLASDQVGRGLMTACVGKLLAYAFGDLQLNRITIAAAVENRKSRAIPERFGMVREGVERQVEWLNGRFVDHVLYSLLRDEYAARPLT